MRKTNNTTSFESYRTALNNLESMYETNSGRKFVHHLIYAFEPDKEVAVLFSKKKLFDCLTKGELKAVFSSRRPVNDEFISTKLDEYREVEGEEIKIKIQEEINLRVKELIKLTPVPRLAYRSPLSDKILGVDELQALKDFIGSQISEGNKTIKNMVKYIRSEKKVGKLSSKKSKQVSSTSLGSDDDLRSKLESTLK